MLFNGKDLYNASKEGKVDQIKEILLTKGIDINYSDPDFQRTSLYRACEKGYLEIVVLLLNHDQIDVNKPDAQGVTPLMIACQREWYDVVKILVLNQSVDVNQPNNNGITPLIFACQSGNVKMLELLLKNRNELDLNQDVRGFTPFFIACQNGQLQVVKILSKKDIDLNRSDDQGTTPFSIACYFGHLDVVKYLLTCKKIDICKPDSQEVTPFKMACEKGYLEIVKVLLEDLRIESDKGDIEGATPFYVACQNGHLGIVELLLASEKEVNLNAKWKVLDRTALEQAKFNSTSPKKDWEITEEEVIKRQQNCKEIVKLIEAFQNDPTKVKTDLRRQLEETHRIEEQMKKRLPTYPLKLYIDLKIPTELPSEFVNGFNILLKFRKQKSLLERESLIENSKIELEYKDFQQKIKDSPNSVSLEDLNQRDESRKKYSFFVVIFYLLLFFYINPRKKKKNSILIDIIYLVKMLFMI